MHSTNWISTALPRRTVAIRQRSIDEPKLPRIDGAFGALMLAFDTALRPARAERLADALVKAGTCDLPLRGGPAAEAVWGDSWSPDLEWSRSPAQVIEHYFDASIVGLGMGVTSFVVLALDADDAEWDRVLEVARTTLRTRPDWRLHAAARDGRCAEVRQAIADGWPLDEFEADTGHSPLHAACVAGHLDVMRLLLDAGADVNRRCEATIGETPLGEVADTCSLAVARVLVEAGADPTIPGWMALTALDRAARRTDAAGAAVLALLRASAARRGR